MATVAHEIRTPLTALSAHIENMADGVTKADKNGIETALTQVERLRDLVRHLLELSKVEAGVTALVQPGGSIRDSEGIGAVDRGHAAMLLTGVRHFRH